MIQIEEARSGWQLRLTVEDTEPPIWRRIAVDDRTTLSDLHRVFQVAMGWLDYHLFEFDVAGIRYEDPDPEAEGQDATGVTLRELGLDVGGVFTYRYDFGDDWTMRVEVERKFRVDRNMWLPAVTAGERAGPPEDAGGTRGLAELLQALADSEHPEHEEYRAWVGEDFAPESFDRRSVNGFLWLAAGWGVIGPEYDEGRRLGPRVSPVEPLGLKRGELLVVPYDHRWSALVDEAAAELVAPLGSSILFARAYVTHSRPIRSTEVDSIITATVDALLNSPLGRNRNLAPGMARTWVEFDFYRPVERPAVTDLFVGRRGDIWLQESDLGDVWLRLGADGQPLQRIEFPADVTLFQADGDLIWGSEVDALGVPYAVRYRVPGT